MKHAWKARAAEHGAPELRRWRAAAVLQKRCAACAALAGVLVPAGLALVQAGGADAREAGAILEEIVVTAQRREESLQSIPVAVTAYSEEDLENLQIIDLSALQGSTPTLVIMPFPAEPGQASIGLRGLFSSEGVITIDPTVGLYVDGVYLARATGANLDMIDIGRVEVMRGPQGTLFGRNTVGGAINLVPNAPGREFEGSLRAGFGNFNAREVRGLVNAPLSDTAALRVVANRSQRDSFARSSETGADLNDDKSDFVRAQMQIDASERMSVLIAGDYSRTSMSGQWVTLIDANPTGQAFVEAASGGEHTSSDFIDRYTDRPASTTDSDYAMRVRGLSATATYDYGMAILKSITAYRDIDSRVTNVDLDGTPFDIINSDLNIKTQEQLSQELQLFGKAANDRMDWIAGAYYFREKGLEFSRARFLFPHFNPNVSITDGDARNVSAAVYGQVTFDLTERLQALGGIRYTRDNRELVLRNRTEAAEDGSITCVTPGGAAPGCEITLPDEDFSYLPFTVGGSYTLAAHQRVYGKWSRGFRSGGFNIRGDTAEGLKPFGEERVDSFELGFKGDFLDRRLRLNAAAFHQRFDDIQVIGNVETAVGVGAAILNAAKAEINGVELELVALLGDLRVAASYGYLDTEYKRVDPEVTQINVDTMFRSAPENTFFVALSYPVSTAFGQLLLHTDYAWTDRVAFGLTPPGPGSMIEGSYGLWSATMRFRFDAPNLELAVWGRNLADTSYLAGALDVSPVGAVSGFPGYPRTLGASATWHF